MADQRDQRSSYEIEKDLEKTRRDMHDAVDAVEDKFTVGHLLDEVWSRISRGDRAVRALGADAGAVARAHPIPLALMGLGVAWLAIEKATSANAQPNHDGHHADGPSAMDKARDKLSGAAPAAKDWTGDASDTGHDLTDRAKEGVHQVGEQVRRRGTQVKRGIRSGIQEQPLVVGAIAFGLGLASGLAVPSSSWEDRTMGGAAEALKGKVKETVEDATKVATGVAGDAMAAARERADRQTATGNLSETARQFAEQAKQIAKQRWPEDSGDRQEGAENAGGRPEVPSAERQI